MSCFSDHVFFISYLLFCFYFLSSVYSVTKKGISVNTEIPFSRKCRRPESNRHGRLVPQDFKSCASASSATAAYPFQEVDGGGFEPPKAQLTDLQSAPFGHSGTHPY